MGKESIDWYFGLAISYLMPGMIALFGISYLLPELRTWFGFVAERDGGGKTKDRRLVEATLCRGELPSVGLRPLRLLQELWKHGGRHNRVCAVLSRYDGRNAYVVGLD
jgi:hypothetical protein